MHKEMVFCVDDEAGVLQALQRELINEPYEVVTATSGAEALARLETQPAAVVISDQRMPGMDGTTFLRKVREQLPDAFRVMLTAYMDLRSLVSSINEGEIHRFLVKPWRLEDLKGAIDEGLERDRLRRKNLELVWQIHMRSRELEELNLTLEQRVIERTRQLEQAYEELVQNEKLSAVGRLAAGVVHEVLNPMTVAVGRIDMTLIDSALPAEHNRSLKIAQEEILRGVRIMDNLRDFSKQRPPKREAVDLNALADRTLELVVHETRRKSIEVTKNFESLPEVRVDLDQLSQVFLNLVNNAIDALEESGHLALETEVLEEDDKQYVAVRFVDDGAGIPEENLSRIFDPFFTTKGDEGTGLGLAICQGIVDVHGGQIRLESTVGKGTTFVIRLPV